MANPRMHSESVVRTAVTKSSSSLSSSKEPNSAQDHNNKNNTGNCGAEPLEPLECENATAVQCIQVDVQEEFIEDNNDEGNCNCECLHLHNGSYQDEEGDTETTIKGEMDQCAQHGIFSPVFFSSSNDDHGGFCTAAAPSTATAKSSDFMILCKTCAHQVFHSSSSSLSSSSLCVHGRRRNPTSSIEKDIVVVVSDQANKSVEVEIAKQDSQKSNPINRPDPKLSVKCRGIIGSDSGASVICLEALKQLLFEGEDVDGPIVAQKIVDDDDVGSDEVQSEAKSLVEALNRVYLRYLFGEKSFRKVPKKNYAPAFCAKTFLENRDKNASNRKSPRIDNGADNEPLLIDFSDPASPDTKSNFAQDLLRQSDGEKPQPPTTSSSSCSRQSVGVECEENGIGGGGDSFEASNRLKRLEEHFKGFVFTKKLLKDECPVTTCSDSSQRCRPEQQQRDEFTQSKHHHQQQQQQQHQKNQQQQILCEFAESTSSTSDDTRTRSHTVLKQNPACLQELGECSSVALRSSLSKSPLPTEPRSTVFRTNSDIDPKRVDFITVRNFSHPGCSYVILNRQPPLEQVKQKEISSKQPQVQHVPETVELQGDLRLQSVEHTSNNKNPSDTEPYSFKKDTSSLPPALSASPSPSSSPLPPPSNRFEPAVSPCVSVKKASNDIDSENSNCPLLVKTLEDAVNAVNVSQTTNNNSIDTFDCSSNDSNSKSQGSSCCEFDVRFLQDFQNSNFTLECYDEFDVENCCENNCFFVESHPIATSQCGSIIEAVPLFHTNNNYYCQPSLHYHRGHYHHLFPATMRELSGPLRGLLKKPNRPPPARKNRVVFDETRNEFFEADYIILIREDCAYDEEDEEPCTCGEHELVRLCCEEGCQCNYGDENSTTTPQSPKYAPPIEFVDEAALSPPDGYKDNGLGALSGALSGHVFGAQHIQQLQVIQRLQQQRAAMLAARASNQQNPNSTSQQNQQHQTAQTPATSPASDEPQTTVCTECAECVECAAKQLRDEECVAVQCQEDVAKLNVPHVALVPLHNNSPERRITQKEIIAGEERPKYIITSQYKDKEVTERRIVHEATTEDVVKPTTPSSSSSDTITISDKKPPIPAKPTNIPAQISGILKGGKLWKSESQTEETANPTSDDESTSKRSVRFNTEGKEILEQSKTEEPINELIPVKKHSALFHNVWRPNSAVRQLFPAGIHGTTSNTALTHEALKAFEESKRDPLVTPSGTASDTDTIRRTIERNALRRSLIKKKAMKPDISLEDRIKQLTCDIDEPNDNSNDDQSSISAVSYGNDELERRDSPAGEENPLQTKYIPDKSFSPSSSASSSSSGSATAYRKISDVFNRDRRQEKIPEAEENPIVIIPQECRCPAAPDLGMGIQVPAAHTQIHQTPPRTQEPRRQFLSTLAPLTACVAGQKDDFSYYTLAAGDRNSTASAQCSDYNLGDIEAALSKDESRKVAPDVIAGTPGQEQDELVIFAQQEAIRTDKIKKRYNNEHQTPVPTSNASSDDDEQNDYGFNKRPTVRGVKAKYEGTNEIIEEMQAQLAQTTLSQQQQQQQHQQQQQQQQHQQQQQQQQQNTGKPFNALKPTNSIGSIGKPQTQAMPPANAIVPNPAGGPWTYYPEEQRADLLQHTNYYQTLPAQFKQATFHEESLMYQNCQSVSMGQYGRFARSPSRRPESPPPLRNYHQTMVLIPYNTQTYAQFTSNNQQAGGQFRRQNVVEYQQVTQQTIRVPIGYTIPGMQLHLVAGRGAQQQQHQHVQYTQNPRLIAPRSFLPSDPNNMKYAERGVPEGSASTTHTDCKSNLMSPTSSQAGSGQQQQQQQQQQNNQCQTQSSTVSPAVPGAVFYAMNV